MCKYLFMSFRSMLKIVYQLQETRKNGKNLGRPTFNMQNNKTNDGDDDSRYMNQGLYNLKRKNGLEFFSANRQKNPFHTVG